MTRPTTLEAATSYIMQGIAPLNRADLYQPTGAETPDQIKAYAEAVEVLDYIAKELRLTVDVLREAIED